MQGDAAVLVFNDALDKQVVIVENGKYAAIEHDVAAFVGHYAVVML